MRIVLFGKDGQVGTAIQPGLAGIGTLTTLGRAEANFERPAEIAGLVRELRPDVVVNAAAYTAVDAAEDDEERAWLVNAHSVSALGEAAREAEALVVHYSTDYVFDGSGARPMAEDAPTGPVSVYGASKLAGEQGLARSGARALIVRTSWVYAPQGRNFPLTILRLAKERSSLKVVADQMGAPTPAGLIAATTLAMIGQAAADDSRLGLYHLAPRGEASWHGVAQLLVREALAAGAELQLGPDDVLPIPASDYPTRAARPANSRLAVDKLQRAFALTLPSWEAGIRQFVAQLRQEGRL